MEMGICPLDSWRGWTCQTVFFKAEFAFGYRGLNGKIRYGCAAITAGEDIYA